MVQSNSSCDNFDHQCKNGPSKGKWKSKVLQKKAPVHAGELTPFLLTKPRPVAPWHTLAIMEAVKLLSAHCSCDIFLRMIMAFSGACCLISLLVMEETRRRLIVTFHCDCHILRQQCFFCLKPTTLIIETKTGKNETQYWTRKVIHPLWGSRL